jgi:flagellar biosynthesis protein FlhG
MRKENKIGATLWPADESYTAEARSVHKTSDPIPRTKGKPNVSRFTRVISFTSGKGGVGKTNTVVNTAIALARAGSSVLLLDADLGLANIDILLGLTARHTIADVLRGERTLEEVMLEGPAGISIIPAASGIESICNLRQSDKQRIIDEVDSIAFGYDYLLIDTSAGISSDVMYFNAASSEIVLVINPEPTSLTDAYAVIKVLASSYREKSFAVLANNVRNEEEGKTAFQQLQRAVDRFLRVRVEYLGSIPSDTTVHEAVRHQRALLELYPSSMAGLAITQFAKRLEDHGSEYRIKGGMQFFFKQLLARDGTNAAGVEV